MIKDYDYKQAFYQGQDCLRKRDYVNAKYWLEIAMQDKKYREFSIQSLVRTEIKKGNHLGARKILDEYKDLNSSALKQMRGFLESIEYNYELSKKCYGECRPDSKSQNHFMFECAKLYMQTGDYQYAKRILETLKLNKDFKIQSTIELVCLEILKKDYDKAYRLLQTIDTRILDKSSYIVYNVLDTLIKSNLGISIKIKDTINPNNEYALYRLYDNSDEILLKHVRKHLNQHLRYIDGCFFKNIDLEKLLSDVREKLENMNSQHFKATDIYRFTLDKPIGFRGDEVTSDIFVSTIIGTKNIVTMYPVLLSNEFDKEGMSTNKELLLKRNSLGIKEEN